MPDHETHPPDNNDQLLRRVLSAIGDGVITVDSDANVTVMNRVAESIVSSTEAEAIGKPLHTALKALTWGVRESTMNYVMRALRGELIDAESHSATLVSTADDRLFEVNISAVCDSNVASRAAIIVFRDVSDRKATGEMHSRLAAIVESSEDAILSKTLDGTIRSWNAAAERVFGYTPEQAIGKHITLIIPADRHDEEREILARIARGERVEHFETIRISSTGAPIDISLTVSPVRDSDGRIVGASKVARDIRQRKRSEDALREADVRKDQFIALLAHELRNPLAPLSNGLQLMRLAGNDLKVLAEARTMMERQLAHMVRLIDDLLDVSRINQNKIELRKTRLTLSDVVSSAVETARPAIEQSRHAFTVSLPTEPVYLDADLTRLAQVFSNLLTNSAKYTAPGGQISLSAVRKGDDVVVTVRDNGMGIPAESLPRIFDMFSQVDRRIERVSGGLGIGLALVKGFVEMHNGTVRVESEGHGKGTAFVVTLRTRTYSLPTSAAVAADAPLIRGASRRVLVADDNIDAAKSLAMVLRSLGHTVSVAHDGEDAVQQAGSMRPDIIFMDLGMPKLSGYDATQRIREKPWGDEMIIIALTGWAQDRDRAHSREAGCDWHLVKPVGLIGLQQVLGKNSREQFVSDSE